MPAIEECLEQEVSGATGEFVPAKLAEWSERVEKPLEPRRKDEIAVGDRLHVTIDHYYRYIAVCATRDFDSKINDREKRLFALQFAFAEMERAVPILRALIEREKAIDDTNA